MGVVGGSAGNIGRGGITGVPRGLHPESRFPEKQLILHSTKFIRKGEFGTGTGTHARTTMLIGTLNRWLYCKPSKTSSIVSLWTRKSLHNHFKHHTLWRKPTYRILSSKRVLPSLNAGGRTLTEHPGHNQVNPQRSR